MRYVLALLLLGGCANAHDPVKVVVDSTFDPTTSALTGCHVETPGVVGHTVDVTNCDQVHVQADPHTTDALSQWVLALIAMAGAFGL